MSIRRRPSIYIRIFREILPQLLLLCALSYILSSAPQYLDIYRDIAQDVQNSFSLAGAGVFSQLAMWYEVTLSGISLAAIFLVSSVSIFALISSSAELGGAKAPAIVNHAAVASVIAASLPLLAAAYGIYAALPRQEQLDALKEFAQKSNFSELVEEGNSIKLAEEASSHFSNQILEFVNVQWGILMLLLVLAGIMLLLGLILIRSLSRRAFGDRARSIDIYWVWRRVGLVALSFSLISVLVAWQPLYAGEILPPIASLSLFAIHLFLMLTLLQLAVDRIGWPLLSPILAMAFLFSWLGINDNHHVRYVAPGLAPAAKQPVASSEVVRWLSSRPDKHQFSNTEYPIYIVAAQGGGSYAALQTVSFLSSIQQRCPSFAAHLLAISSVSGGSVGATMFSALMRSAQLSDELVMPEGGCFVENIDSTLMVRSYQSLESDFWAPLQAAMIFPDFLQRFLFFPIDGFDRAKALERAIESSWRYAAQKSDKEFSLESLFVEMWAPEDFPLSPALIINTTNVATGGRELISPFRFYPYSGSGGLSFVPLNQKVGGQIYSIPLSTAAVLSARFPVVTPAGRIDIQFPETGKLRRVQLVDGGYFENSGVATASDFIKGVVKAIKDADALEAASINLIVLTSADSQGDSNLSAGEFSSPIFALLNTRQARGKREIAQAYRDLQKVVTSEGFLFRMMVVDLKSHGYPLPLGWRLSDISHYIVGAQQGSEKRCASSLSGINSGPIVGPDCVRKFLIQQLCLDRIGNCELRSAAR